MIGTSAALAVSGIPFDGPIGAARVAFHPETGYLLNPNYEQLKASSLDMVVAGTKDAVLMVESEAKELTEDQMLGNRTSVVSGKSVSVRLAIGGRRIIKKKKQTQ